MKMYLDKDEWYPVYTLREEHRPYLTEYWVDVSSELMERHKKIIADFDALQDELSKLPTVKVKPTETL